MCLVKKPKPIAVTKASDKPLPILRNPYLDGLDPILRARQTGVSSLRIDRGSKPASNSLTISRPAATAAPSPATLDPRAAAQTAVDRFFGRS